MSFNMNNIPKISGGVKRNRDSVEWGREDEPLSKRINNLHLDTANNSSLNINHHHQQQQQHFNNQDEDCEMMPVSENPTPQQSFPHPNSESSSSNNSNDCAQHNALHQMHNSHQYNVPSSNYSDINKMLNNLHFCRLRRLQMVEYVKDN